eukprot:362722-Chlamydomonas_euryale.AAC.2
MSARGSGSTRPSPRRPSGASSCSCVSECACLQQRSHACLEDSARPEQQLRASRLFASRGVLGAPAADSDGSTQLLSW